ncbi:P-loop containing nucleoside triphosphate hydrolase protein [Pyronema omphalodes]|nr:P-loop containing nucleoside triphosphate hydrolase protein [Pyronema omphalodes]
MDIPLFASTQLELLAAEQGAEITEQTSLINSLPPVALQRHGLAVLNLVLSAQRTGLGGRTVLELEPDSALTTDGKLTSHGLRSGDIVRIEEQPGGAAKKKEKTELKEKGVEGVVHRVFENKLVIAIGKDDDTGVEALVTSGKRLWAVKMSNEVTWRRMVKCMETLKDMGEKGTEDELTRVLFGKSSPAPPEDLKGEVKFLDEGLNDSQKRAVEFALGTKDIALIHGPPGTGKTQTLLEIIRQFTSQTPPKRVLVCGPSNISVDNIVLRLPPDLPIVRLGHPARLLPRVLAKSLDVLTQTSEAGEIARDVRQELDTLMSKLVIGGKNRIRGKERKEGWEQVRHLRSEFRWREGKATRDLVSSSKVVLSTLHGAGGHQLRGEKFDVVIIDEGSQALEAQCWIPLLMSSGVSKLILAGDHLQLPPTVKSTAKPLNLSQPKEKRFHIPISLEDTLFSRLLDLHGPGIKRLLNVQYRMHENIMHFPSKYLYDSELVADPSVAKRLLSDLPHVEENEDTVLPVLFIDTQGGDFPEAVSDDESSTKKPSSSSQSNPLEAALTINYVRSLIAAGVQDAEIAVITPYNGQLGLLTSALRPDYPGLELGSVDGFQGREKEAIVLSLVRSNDKREAGFLREGRRLNVAMTRARRHLCVIGDSETVKHAGGYLAGWLKWVEEGGEVRYPDVSDVLQV